MMPLRIFTTSCCTNPYSGLPPPKSKSRQPASKLIPPDQKPALEPSQQFILASHPKPLPPSFYPKTLFEPGPLRLLLSLRSSCHTLYRSSLLSIRVPQGSLWGLFGNVYGPASRVLKQGIPPEPVEYMRKFVCVCTYTHLHTYRYFLNQGRLFKRLPREHDLTLVGGLLLQSHVKTLPTWLKT